ncbi:hypothetical protein PEDI_52830 [Persicobacter diffluens]|uniref:Transposase IS204/IS1001/IS1096/IS1165 DDE domain-containing protein n=1 Tax=Persicobacter diffluens TaxID=981 RepID=A0AAN4W300_9BACT|nr:hypothetical protein PEDI_52830 [Persicobacter diffluens]
MNLIIQKCFANADTTLDRFHIQQLASEAVQKIRIIHRWEAIEQEAEAIKEARESGEKHKAELYSNGDTRKQLLTRARHLLFKPCSKWTATQKERTKILFS